MNIISHFKEISSRGRVAYAICCLENLLEIDVYDNKWKYVLENLWTFCNQNTTLWQEKVGEIMPSVIFDTVPFEEQGNEYITKEIYLKLFALYSRSEKNVLDAIELIYEIGITNNYVIISTDEKKKEGLEYLEKLITITISAGAPIPNVNLFNKFSIDENNGWGREFTREEVFK